MMSYDQNIFDEIYSLESNNLLSAGSHKLAVSTALTLVQDAVQKISSAIPAILTRADSTSVTRSNSGVPIFSSTPRLGSLPVGGFQKMGIFYSSRNCYPSVKNIFSVRLEQQP
jgi:hypothetical protein